MAKAKTSDEWSKDNDDKIAAYKKDFGYLRRVSKPLMVALFTFKGGVGKTTLTELLAQTLARIGFTVLVVDGDRQMNITTFFKGNPPKPQLSPEKSNTPSDEEAADILAALSSTASLQEQQEEILAALQGYGYDAVVPSIEGDPLTEADVCPMTSDFLIGMERDDTDNILSALLRYQHSGPGKDPDIRLRQVQTDLYNGQNGTGKIYLLPGSEQLDSLATDYSTPGSNFYRRATAAFRRMVLHAAQQVGATIVLTDMGPSTDVINRTFATSCDVIQPCTAPEMFSWSGSVMQTVVVLPDWLKFYVERRQLDRTAAAAAGEEDNYNPHFPRIMPFIGMQYVYEARDRKIQWSHSNMFRAFEAPFKELRRVLEKGALTDPAAAAAVLQQAAQADDIPLEAHWVDYLNTKGPDPQFSMRLEMILNTLMVKTSSQKPQVVVPLLRHARHMGMAHELGVALFDITEDAILDYYENVDMGRVKRLAEQAHAEGVVLLGRMLSLSAAYATLLAQHNNAKRTSGASGAGASGAGASGAGASGAGASGAGASGAGASGVGASGVSPRRQQRTLPAPSAKEAAPPVPPQQAPPHNDGGSGRSKRAAAELAAAAIKKQAIDSPHDH